MASFNKRTVTTLAPTSFITSQPLPTGTTYNGAAGFERDPKSELFLLAVANFVGEDTFYEMSSDRDKRFRDLVQAVAVTDPAWMRRFIFWLRNDAYMRTASVVAGVEAARAMVARKLPGGRLILATALQRADEPGEAVAYWLKHYGRKMPKAVKRGIGDAARRLYTEFSLLKYDTDAGAVRFADVLELTHPRPATLVQGPVFQHIIDRRHGRPSIQQIVGNGEAAALPMVYANVVLRSKAFETPDVLFDSGALRAAGMTWEDTMSLAGQLPGARDKRAKLWEAQIPSMGYMALLRNLRKFDQDGISDEVAKQVANRLVDPEQVARSKQFPYRFLSAYRAVQSLRWGQPLEIALNLSLANVPELPGRTLILVDRSGSMFMTAQDGLTRADQAAIFGTALALRNFNRADLVQFGTKSMAVRLSAGESLLRAVDGRFSNLGGTSTAEAVRTWFKGHDRIVIITDEQADYAGRNGVDAGIPASVAFYTWNLGGYKFGHTNTQDRRYTFGGLSDSAFRMIPLLERGISQDWPF